MRLIEQVKAYIMNCTEFHNTLIDATGAGLDEQGAELQVAFDAHRAACADCQASYESEISLLTGLQQMPVPTPTADFADRVLGAAVAQTAQHNVQKKNVQKKGEQHRQGFLLGFGSAAVAAMALWVVVGVFPVANAPEGTTSDETVVASAASNSGTQSPALSIALNQQQDIKLAFYSGEPLKGAKITIRLPENVALVGYPGRRQLSWTTNLKKGDNLLRLPVIAMQIARGDLVADIEYGDQLKTLTVSLEANVSDTSRNGFKANAILG